MAIWDIPTTLLNCWGWYTADTLGLSNGATVATWADRTTNARNLTGSSATYATNALNGKGVVNIAAGGYVRTPAVTSSLNAGSTIVAVQRYTADGEGPWDNSAVYWYSVARSSPNGFGYGSTIVKTSTNQVSAGTSWHLGTISHAAASVANVWPAAKNTTIYSVDDCDVICENGRSGPTVGNTIDFPRTAAMSIAELAIFDRVLMRFELYEIHRYLAAKWGLWWPGADTAATALLWQGNSTTRYSGGVASALAQADRSQKWIQESLAVDGTNSVESYAQRDHVEALASYWRTRKIPPILIWHHGHNDNSTWNIDVIGDPNGPIQRFRRAGGRVMLHTMSQWAGRDDSDRQVLNAWIRANWASVADGMYDLGGSALFGIWDNGGSSPSSAPPGTSRGDTPANWVDQVHPTLAGQQAKAALVLPSLKAMATRLSLVGNTPGVVTLSTTAAPSGWACQWLRYAGEWDALNTTATRGSAIAGATSTTLVDTAATPNVVNTYRVLWTHATQGFAYSDPIAVQPIAVGPACAPPIHASTWTFFDSLVA